MRGRTLILGSAAFVAIFAAALVYTQFFAYYQAEDGLETLATQGRPVPVAGYDGIVATSSPLKLRGCFRIAPEAVAALQPAEDATPLNAPFWFRCFDAGTLTEDIASGAARAFAITRDEPQGFDTLLAVYPDGRGYVWRQLNARFAS